MQFAWPVDETATVPMNLAVTAVRWGARHWHFTPSPPIFSLDRPAGWNMTQRTRVPSAPAGVDLWSTAPRAARARTASALQDSHAAPSHRLPLVEVRGSAQSESHGGAAAACVPRLRSALEGSKAMASNPVPDRGRSRLKIGAVCSLVGLRVCAVPLSTSTLPACASRSGPSVVLAGSTPRKERL